MEIIQKYSLVLYQQLKQLDAETKLFGEHLKLMELLKNITQLRIQLILSIKLYRLFIETYLQSYCIPPQQSAQRKGIITIEYLDSGIGDKIFSLAMQVKTVKDLCHLSRPSVVCTIATDWVTYGCLKWCLMYSRTSEF